MKPNPKQSALRVHRGRLRGRSIAAPPAVRGHSHFTGGLVKESVFQIIEQRLAAEPSNYAFFDLCAGSGQMALEAFSVDFGSVYACEVDRQRLKHLSREFATLAPAIRIQRRDLRRAAPLFVPYANSVAYIDPPYSFYDRHGRSEAVHTFTGNLIDALTSPDSGEGTVPMEYEVILIVQSKQEYALSLPASGGDWRILSQEVRSYRGQMVTFFCLRMTRGARE